MQQHQDQLSDVDGTVRQRNLGAQPSIYLHCCLLTILPCNAGISVDETGKQHYLDATVAFKRAVLNCIDYLSKFGYTKRQARPAPRPRLGVFTNSRIRPCKSGYTKRPARPALFPRLGRFVAVGRSSGSRADPQVPFTD